MHIYQLCSIFKIFINISSSLPLKIQEPVLWLQTLMPSHGDSFLHQGVSQSFPKFLIFPPPPPMPFENHLIW